MPYTIDPHDVRSYIVHLGFNLELPAGCSTYLFLSGAQLSSGDAYDDGATLDIEPVDSQPDHYDDLCLTYTAGDPLLRGNRSTVDPGTYHMRKDGRANLVWTHPHRFVAGKHNGNGQDVLRPKNGSNRYWRDDDDDERQDPEEVIRTGNGSMLIHAMGGSRIQRWGAGCIGIWDAQNYRGPVWAGWRGQAYRTTDTLREIQVVIVPARDFIYYLLDPSTHRPMLWPGATGKWVRVLQTSLGLNRVESGGSGLTVDGDFGKGTLAALQEFQRAQGLTDDGICGVKTWGALGTWVA